MVKKSTILLLEERIKWVNTLKTDKYNLGYICALQDCIRWIDKLHSSNSTKEISDEAPLSRFIVPFDCRLYGVLIYIQ